MNARALIDANRLRFSQDATIAPTRAVTYQRDADLVIVSLNAFVGVGAFNKTEKDIIGRYQSFGGLPLAVIPQVNDIVNYDGTAWKVIRHTKMGQMYTVICENKRHNGRPV